MFEEAREYLDVSVYVPGFRIPKPVDFSHSLGGSTLADLQQALEDYLLVLLGLVKDGSHLQYKVQFVWVNQEDDAEETGMSNAWPTYYFSQEHLPMVTSQRYQKVTTDLFLALQNPKKCLCPFWNIG
nr:hypothetical protein CFP56_42677 [Quercus suber]